MSKSQAPSPRRWRRFFFRAGIVLIVLAIAAPAGIGWIIGSQLKSQVATQLNARLDFHRVVYEFPYGVRVEKAHLVLPANNGAPASWVDINRLELSLAKLPIGKGPVLIQKLDIADPIVHLAASPPTSTPAPATAPASTPQKLSDFFQLQNVTISNGRLEYDSSQLGEAVPPMVWAHLDAAMNTTAASPGVYHYVLALADLPLVKADGTGWFDIDTLQLNVDKINLALLCDPHQQTQQIPPREMAVIQRYQLAGQLNVQVSGAVPFESTDQATFIANLDLKNGHCQIPGWAGAIKPTNCSLTASKANGPLRFALAMQDAHRSALSVAGALDLKTMLLDLEKVESSVQFDPANPIMTLPAALADSLGEYKTGGELTLQGNARIPLQSPTRLWCSARLTLKNGQCQPAGWNGLITPVKCVIAASNVPSATGDSLPQAWPAELSDNSAEPHVWISSLSAASGDQIFKLDGGELIFNPAENTWTARKLQGVADVGAGPGPLRGDNLRVILPFVAAGDSKTGLRIALDDAFATGTANHIHLNRIDGQVTLTPTGLTTSNLVATCAGGQVNANIKLGWNPPVYGPALSLIYGADLQVKQLDLHQMAIDYTPDPSVRQRVVGTMDFNVNCHGSILKHSPQSGVDTAADRLEAQGDFDISNGHFADIPVLKNVVAAMNDPGGSTVGEAAARFGIAHQVIRFKRAAASSPTLGIQGSGTLGFDQKLNMSFVATPLADWSKDIKGAGIVSDAGAAIVGKFQDVFNGVQRAIYQFRVTGDISNPKVTAVPVPFLSDGVTSLFHRMAGDQSQGSVAEGLRKQGDSESK